MKEKLIIKDFGPIKSVELELGSFNVLIGENATGKSVVAKLLAVCKYFSYILDDNLFPNAFEDGLNSWGMGEFIRDNSYIFYECEHYSFIAERGLKEEIDIDQENGNINYKYNVPVFHTDLKGKSNEFGNLLKELEALKPKESQGDEYGYYQESWTIPTSFFQNDVSAVLNNPFYVPTERGLQSIFSLGKNSIQNLSDSLFNQLAELHQIAVSFKSETVIEPFNISYKNEKGEGFIKKETDEKYYSLINAASGYKSTIPLILLIKNYTEIRKKKKVFIIEEPELNLFPVRQKELTQYLVEATVNFQHSMLLTTHSPYILSSLNNLMYAQNVADSSGKILEVESVIQRKYWINAKDVSAYLIKTEGISEDIMNKEESMIDAHRIDEISTQINKDFDELINIELGITYENN